MMSNDNTITPRPVPTPEPDAPITLGGARVSSRRLKAEADQRENMQEQTDRERRRLAALNVGTVMQDPSLLSGNGQAQATRTLLLNDNLQRQREAQEAQGEGLNGVVETVELAIGVMDGTGLLHEAVKAGVDDSAKSDRSANQGPSRGHDR